jgi:hypothetical protein
VSPGAGAMGGSIGAGTPGVTAGADGNAGAEGVTGGAMGVGGACASRVAADTMRMEVCSLAMVETG